MELIHDSAIVLRRLDYSETSLILAVFTRDHGKVRIIAKGARRSTKKRFSPGMDLLDAGSLVLSVRHVGQEALAPLREWKQIAAYAGLRDRLDRLYAAQYAADIVTKLTEDWDPHARIYDGLNSTLATLAGGGETGSTLTSFQRLLLVDTGLLPRLDVCIGCGQSPTVGPEMYFSSHEGGLLCRDCEPARVEKRLVTAGHAALSGAAIASGADVAGIFDLFNYHIAHLIGREPAAAEPLGRLLRHPHKPDN